MAAAVPGCNLFSKAVVAGGGSKFKAVNNRDGNFTAANGSKESWPPYDPVLIFKIPILQTFYTLSDDATEFQIRGRLSFMRFLGLGFDRPLLPRTRG